MDFVDIYPFLVAMLIGALIGTERQRRLAEEKVRGVAGLRTFILISLLGALSATLAAHYGSLFAVGALSSFIILVAVGYASAVSSLGRIDLTAAVAAVVAFVLGMLANDPDKIALAVSLAIITTWILATRTVTHRYVEALNEADLLDTLKMGIIALVIYPILPLEAVDPWRVINLRQIWLFVILVSLIGYTGYILIRILGAERGLTLTGILGGLASSIAVTSSLAEESKINPQLLSSAVFATAIASSTVFPRVFFIAAIVNKEVLPDLFIPLLTMTAVGVALAYISHRKSPPQGGRGEGLRSLPHPPRPQAGLALRPGPDHLPPCRPVLWGYGNLCSQHTLRSRGCRCHHPEHGHLSPVDPYSQHGCHLHHPGGDRQHPGETGNGLSPGEQRIRQPDSGNPSAHGPGWNPLNAPDLKRS